MNTEELFGMKNPWEHVAKMYESLEEDCLFSSSKSYVCEGDEQAIDVYNEKVDKAIEGKDEETKLRILRDKIITNIPAEPWWGNPLEARLIILSLNPGYVPEVNMTLAKLMQSKEVVRKQVIEYKRKTLLFQVHSLMPEKKDNIEGSPITCKDAINMLGDWYWYKKLEQLRKDVYIENASIDETKFFRKIALVELHGYSSQTSNRTFPRIDNTLESQQFTKEMIWYLAKDKKKDVRFLIMRSTKKWINLLSEEFFVKFKDKIIEKKTDSMISQYITPANFNGNEYRNIIDFINNS